MTVPMGVGHGFFEGKSNGENQFLAYAIQRIAQLWLTTLN